jgi:hypothetical protein
MSERDESTVPKPPPKPLVGWQCPVCGAGNAPWSAYCPCRTQTSAGPGAPGLTPYTLHPQPYCGDPRRLSLFDISKGACR